MRSKFFILGIPFVILASLNIWLAGTLYNQQQKTAHTAQVLNEIEKGGYVAKTFPSSPLVLGSYDTQITQDDGRASNLKSFFRKYNSPLYDSAEHIVAVSDKYGFDYRLLPAIAMQESNVCLKIPPNSHNCWGWGIYGDNVLKFASFDEAIDEVSRGIKEEYIDKGMVTASQIMKVYNPSSNGSWAYGVNLFLRALE